MNVPFLHALQETFAKHASRPALVHMGRTWTYAQLDREIRSKYVQVSLAQAEIETLTRQVELLRFALEPPGVESPTVPNSREMPGSTSQVERQPRYLYMRRHSRESGNRAPESAFGQRGGSPLQVRPLRPVTNCHCIRPRGGVGSSRR